MKTTILFCLFVRLFQGFYGGSMHREKALLGHCASATVHHAVAAAIANCSFKINTTLKKLKTTILIVKSRNQAGLAQWPKTAFSRCSASMVFCPSNTFWCSSGGHTGFRCPCSYYKYWIHILIKFRNSEKWRQHSSTALSK